jgi:hypothetical protein
MNLRTEAGIALLEVSDVVAPLERRYLFVPADVSGESDPGFSRLLTTSNGPDTLEPNSFL